MQDDKGMVFISGGRYWNFKYPTGLWKKILLSARQKKRIKKMMEVNEFKYLGTTLCKKKEQG